jgi:hypothetical protein
MTPIAATPPIAVTTPSPVEPVASFNPTDLDRLRELIQSAASQTANPLGSTPALAVSAADAVGKPTGRSFGDTILEGVLRFGNNYESSMHSIETRLQEVVRTESSGLTNFSDILALQIDVSKWSMSVMGVDNASKAGSNTIKELSHGG